jgi:O-antigen ligase
MTIKSKPAIFKLLLTLYITLFFIPKGVALEGLLAIGMLYLSVLKIRESGVWLQREIYQEKLLFLIVMFLTLQLVSSIFSSFPSDALYQFRKVYLLPILSGFSILVFYKEINFRYVYQTMSVALLVLGVYYFYESYEIHGYIDLSNYEFSTSRDATFTIPILFPFVIFGMYEFYKDKFFSIVSLFGMFLAILIVMYSGSRGAVLAFSTEIVVFMYFTIVSKNIKYIVFPIIFIGLFFGILNNPTMDKKFQEATSRGLSDNGRIDAQKSFVEVAMDNAIIGVGIGNKSTDGVIREYGFRIKTFEREDGILLAGPHNTFIKILYQTGIVPLLAYVFIIGLIVYRTFRVKRYALEYRGKLAFALMTVYLDHFVLRASVEDLKLEKFILIVFMSIALYHTTLKKDNNENSVHIP